jgi:cell wall-associated NlpC family hydrolase
VGTATNPGTTASGATPGTPVSTGANAPASGASTGPGAPASGGASLAGLPAVPCTPAHPTVPGFVAAIINGVAYAPAQAPAAVQRAIWAGNDIRTKPYIWGGGHGSFQAAGYDCSGSVSYVLHAAGLLKTPMDSSDLMNWGGSGTGGWITVYTNPGHAFVEIAGIRLDTSAEADPHPARGSGPRWRPLYANPAGFQARHPLGY